jgi:hypothetical protein
VTAWTTPGWKDEPMTTDPALDAARAVIEAITATDDEADTVTRQLLEGEVAIIITGDGASVFPVKGKTIRID